jgi:hypothetical protein
MNGASELYGPPVFPVIYSAQKFEGNVVKYVSQD